MGQFEIKGTKREELVPDLITLIVGAKVEKENVLDSTESVLKTHEELKSSVAKLVCDLESVTKDCCVSFSDLRYDKIASSLPTQDTFGIVKKKKENYVTISASTTLSIKLTTRDETILTNILKLLLDSIFIVNIFSSVNVSNYDEECLKLKSEVCKKCRADAEIIVTSLGSEITGVAKVVYNSSGNLLDIKPADNYSVDDFDDFDCFEDEECDDSSDFGLDTVKYDEVWAKGFAKTVLDKKYILEDSVTVVFEIK